MPTEVVMPQMGESIAEGTVVRWIKRVGDAVERDEPLFEISTDKVDAEVPAPVAGVLTEIKVQEGETVAVNSVVATIGQPGETAALSPAQQQANGDAVSSAHQASAPAPTPRANRNSVSASVPRPRVNGAQPSRTLTADERRHQRSSPLVRRIAAEHNVDIASITGSGIGGRVTKDDILGYINKSAGQAAHPIATKAAVEVTSPAAATVGVAEIQPMSIMRKKIAEHMVLSRRTSAHVYSVFHVDFSTIDKLRREMKDEYERKGAKLTYLAFIAKTVVDALRRHPVINASIDGDNIVYKKDVNLGIAVALDDGLIVPVIRNADERNLLGLSRAIGDLADRARSKQLKPEEVQGGTFTITNPGQLGAQFGLPIINQPQVAILYVGAVEKRPVVVDDAIAIRTMAYLTIGFDHRLIDGAVADRFMADLKDQLEHFEPGQA
jgi:pyruvate dehydrogenase E2 component (dihydrolipoamide acetyltransferase)